MLDLEIGNFFSVSEFSNFKAAQIKGIAAKMKLNVIFVLRIINSIKLQGIHFYIIDIYVSGNQGVKTLKSVVFFSVPVYFTNFVF